jgi:hypothetical protein
LHTVGLPAIDNPLRLDSPTVLAVGPLLRELIIAYTGSDADTPERTRLRAVLLDQLRISPQQPLHVPTPLAFEDAFREHGVAEVTRLRAGVATPKLQRDIVRQAVA